MQVMLAHGLGRTPLSMWMLRHRLRQAGHRPAAFGYLPWAESYDRIRSRLSARLRALDEAGPWAAIGHSLGGLLLRDAIHAAAPRHLAQLIMLGTPNHPPRLAPKAMGIGPFRWFSGDCGRQLASAEFFARLPDPAYPVTVMVGTRGVYGRRSPFGDELNDGIVAVSEALLRPDDFHYTFPVTHTFIMNDREVQRAVLDTLTAAQRSAA